MIPFAKIAGGAPSSVSGLTAHLQTQTLTDEQARLARYYQRGMVADSLMVICAKRVAEGSMDLGHAVDLLTDTEMPKIPKPTGEEQQRFMVWDQDHWVYTRDLDQEREEQRFRIEDRVTARLDVLVDRIERGLLDAPLAVVRPDIHPLALRGLGIAADGVLSDDAISALLSGHRADGTDIEGKRYAVTHSKHDPRTGEDRGSQPLGAMDFAPSPHKSVSVAWAFASPVEQAMLFNAHIEAARESVAYIANEIGQARIGEGGADGKVPGHVGWLEFTHHTSRRTVIEVTTDGVRFEPTEQRGDMDLHTHFLIPNAVFCEDGRIGSLDTRALAGFIMEADGHYQALLRQKLEAAGFDVGWDERTGAARMNLVTDDICAVFSKRTNMGEALARQTAKERGEDWDKLTPAQHATRMKNATQHHSQKRKGGKDDVADVEDWLRQAKEAGWQPPSSFMAPERKIELDHEQRIRQAYEIGLPWLDEKLQHQSVLKHWDARCAALRGLVAAGGYRGLDDVAAVTRLMREEGVLQYGEKTALLWGQEAGVRHVSVSTALHETQEKEFLTLAKAAAADRSGAFTAREVDAAARQSGLDFSTDHGKAQLKAIHTLGEGGRFGVAVGTAGAGKSAMLKVLTSAAEKRNIDVWGASLAWRQADDRLMAVSRKTASKPSACCWTGCRTVPSIWDRTACWP
ncbi:MAG: MobF family relaxase [Rhodopila sp.]